MNTDLSRTKELTSKVPNYFIGWVQMAEAALVLDDRASGSTAGTNLIALGVIDNRNVKILGVMLIERRFADQEKDVQEKVNAILVD